MNPSMQGENDKTPKAEDTDPGWFNTCLTQRYKRNAFAGVALVAGVLWIMGAIVIIVGAVKYTNRRDTSLQKLMQLATTNRRMAAEHRIDLPKNRCVTATCNDTAALVTMLLNASVDPCKNFFEFACAVDPEKFLSQGFQDLYGGNGSTVAARVAQHYTDTYSTLKRFMGRMLNVKSAVPPSAWLAKARAYYRSCSNRSQDMQQPSIEYLANQLQSIFSSAHLDSMLGLIRVRFSLNLVFDVMYSMASPKDAIEVSQTTHLFVHTEVYRQRHAMPTLWSREYDAALQRLGNITASMDALFRLLNLSLPVNLIEQLIDFEEQLALLAIPFANVTAQWAHDLDEGHLLSIDQLDKADFTSWHWERYFNSIPPDIRRLPLRFLFRHTNYLRNAVALVSQRSPTFMQQYVIVKLLSHLQASFYSQPTHRLFLESNFEVQEANLVSLNSIDRDCAETMFRLFPAIPIQTMKQHLVTEDLEEELQHILRATTKAVLDSTRTTPWLSAEADLVRQKLQQMQTLTLHPAALLNDTNVDTVYQTLSMPVVDDYLRSALRFLEFYGVLSLTSSYQLYVYAFFPFYVPKLNTMAVQGLFLRPPYFLREWPTNVKFATLGQAVAHEIAHAFDRAGWFYGPDGSYRPVEHRSANFQKIWTQQETCLVNYYQQFRLGSAHHLQLPGYQVLSENIADIVGVRLSFAAYRAQGETAWLSQLPYSPDQLFFIALGQSAAYCVHKQDVDMAKTVLTDTHSPSYVRLNAMLQNTPEFGQAFGCPLGSPMYPHCRCTLIL